MSHEAILFSSLFFTALRYNLLPSSEDIDDEPCPLYELAHEAINAIVANARKILCIYRLNFFNSSLYDISIFQYFNLSIFPLKFCDWCIIGALQLPLTPLPNCCVHI